MKYLIYFCLPSFYSFRARIRVQHSNTITDVGNVPSMQIDVRGDTWQAITVPYLNWRTWTDQAGSITNLFPILYIEQLSTIIGAPSPSTAVIYVNIFRAGGEDLQFACLTDPNGTLVQAANGGGRADDDTGIDMSKYQKQCSLADEFAKTFPTISTGTFFTEEVGMTMSETVDSVNDILKRACIYPSTSTSGPGRQTGILTNHGIVTSCFMWQRGSRIFRHVHVGNTSTHGDGWYLNLETSTTKRLDYGWAPAYQSAVGPYQQEAIMVPWYNATPYIASYGYGTNYVAGFHQRVVPVQPVLSLGTPDTVTISGGDDYCMLFQVPWANQIPAMQAKQKKAPRRVVDKRSSSKQ